MDDQQVKDLSADDAPMGFDNIRVVWHLQIKPVFYSGHPSNGVF
jgi:hypothetical protein